MGNCCSGDAAVLNPDIDVGIEEEVFLTRPIKMATMGPMNEPSNDVTAQVRDLFAAGQNYIGNVRSVLGVMFPGREAEVRLRIWFLPEAPDEEWDDGDESHASSEKELKGIVVFATFCPAGLHDVTESVKALQRKGKNKFFGKMADHLGNPFPGQRCTFKAWYSS